MLAKQEFLGRGATDLKVKPLRTRKGGQISRVATRALQTFRATANGRKAGFARAESHYYIIWRSPCSRRVQVPIQTEQKSSRIKLTIIPVLCGTCSARLQIFFSLTTLQNRLLDFDYNLFNLFRYLAITPGQQTQHCCVWSRLIMINSRFLSRDFLPVQVPFQTEQKNGTPKRGAVLLVRMKGLEPIRSPTGT